MIAKTRCAPPGGKDPLDPPFTASTEYLPPKAVGEHR